MLLDKVGLPNARLLSIALKFLVAICSLAIDRGSSFSTHFIKIRWIVSEDKTKKLYTLVFRFIVTDRFHTNTFVVIGISIDNCFFLLFRSLLKNKYELIIRKELKIALIDFAQKQIGFTTLISYRQIFKVLEVQLSLGINQS